MPQKANTFHLIKTSNGLTAEYNGRLLYSKYAPAKSAIAAVKALSILPGTLIAVCSPVLCYGLDVLLKNLPSDCFVAAIESDDNLFQAAQKHFPKNSRCILLKKSEINDFTHSLCKGKISNRSGTATGVLPGKCGARLKCGSLRRCVRLDLSAGVQFNRCFYDNVAAAFEEAISRYWKNRLILIRFGRLYSRNLFRNIARLPYSTKLSQTARTVSLPILVAGAGESVESAAHIAVAARNKIHIIAVDAALPALLKMGLMPDDVVTEDAQSIIADCFVGAASAVNGGNRKAGRKPFPLPSAKKNAAKGGSPLAGKGECRLQEGDKDCLEQFNKPMRAFLSLTGFCGAFDAVKDWANITYYASDYCNAQFLHSMEAKSLIPPLFMPLGSVGLTAVRLAIMMRLNENVPIFTAGLDFCYSIGATHVRGAAACIKRLSSSNRLSPCEAYNASFGEGAIKVPSASPLDAADMGCPPLSPRPPLAFKVEKRTMPNLSLYHKLFNEQFSGVHNLFDARDGMSALLQKNTAGGINALGAADTCPPIAFEHKSAAGAVASSGIDNDKCKKKDDEIAMNDMLFYEKEKKALNELKELLCNGNGLMSNMQKISAHKRIAELLRPREYLYLHFPDYNESVFDTLEDETAGDISECISFLRRVRAEADFFLKDIEIGMRTLDD